MFLGDPELTTTYFRLACLYLLITSLTDLRTQCTAGSVVFHFSSILLIQGLGRPKVDYVIDKKVALPTTICLFFSGTGDLVSNRLLVGQWCFHYLSECVCFFCFGVLAKCTTKYGMPGQTEPRLFSIFFYMMLYFFIFAIRCWLVLSGYFSLRGDCTK